MTTVLIVVVVWLFLLSVILMFFRGANLKKRYPKPPQDGMTWLEPPEPIIYPPYPGNGADFPGGKS